MALRDQPLGTYLVRFSSSSPGNLTISAVIPGEIKHYKWYLTNPSNFKNVAKKFPSRLILPRTGGLILKSVQSENKGYITTNVN